MQAPPSATGTFTHEGISYASNTQTADEMKAALGIAIEEASPSSDGEVVTDAAPAAEVADPAPAPPSPDTPAPPAEGKAKEKKRERYEDIDRQRHEAIEAAAAEKKAREASERKIEELRAEWRREFDDLKRAQQPKPDVKADPATTDPEPDYTDTAKYADGQFDRKYLKDQARWEARQEFQVLRQQEQERSQTEQRERQQYERQQQEHQRIAGFAQKIEGVLKDQPELRARLENVSMTRPMWDAVIESDRPHEILAYMADHSEEAVEIAGLAPLAALRRMSRIDYSLEQAGAITGAAPVKPKTSAHPPVSPVSGSHAAPSSGPPGPDASYEEHKAYWDQQEREELKGRSR